MYSRFIIGTLLILASTTSTYALRAESPPPGKNPTICVQVIQYAENTTSHECQAFSTPCDVPNGWTPVKECKMTPEKKVVEPVFEVKKFESCSDLNTTLTNIFERYQDRYWYPYTMYR